MAQFSILTAVFNPPLWAFEECIKSVLNQKFGDWEWCVADDCSTNPEIINRLEALEKQDSRIRVVFRSTSGGITQASRNALDAATGNYITLLDQGDSLAIEALEIINNLIVHSPGTDYIYSDEDKIDKNGFHFDEFCKPDWAPERLLGQNYCGHLSVFRHSLVKQVGGFRTGFDGSQDYDLVLRVSEQSKHIHHIPAILYHKRVVEGIPADEQFAKSFATESAKQAVIEHLKRTLVEATVASTAHGYQKVVRLLHSFPKVSIVIPSAAFTKTVRGKQCLLLDNCLNSILKKTTYPNYEVVIVLDKNEFRENPLLKATMTDERITIVDYEKPFDFSDKCNIGAVSSSGEILLFLNDDTEVITPNWLEILVGHLSDPGVGAVSARLLLEDGTIQSAGHANNPHPHIFGAGSSTEDPGQFGSLAVAQERSGVTGACLGIQKDFYLLIGGMSLDFPACFNDVDLCFKILELKKRIIWTPFADLFHFESLSRIATPYDAELEALSQRWSRFYGEDRYINLPLSFNSVSIKQETALEAANTLFDSDWYLATYPDVALSGMNPLVHYVTMGGFQGFDPSPLFDSDWYLATYPDVALWGMNPLVHFVTTGDSDSHQPSPLSKSRNLPRVPMAFPSSIGPVPVNPKTDRRVTIIIPVHGQWHWTERCLRSLALTEAADLAFVVVVDDASTDQTLSNLARFPWVEVRRAESNLGFTRACNFGALSVDTEYILFLNNDTEPLPGFLEPLLKCADTESDVGIVGSKLIYPDGILQEAGSIIWRDGSGYNFGKNQDAEHYSYLSPRNVDYCSGASILIRTSLFKEFNGFDERFAPAYYEDVDLSFMARQAGYHTRYEPSSVVIHHEGGSHGRDVAKGLKAYQLTNKEKFYEKWKIELQKHSLPHEVLLRHSASSGHKARPIILYCDSQCINPTNDAGSLRTFEILLLLQGLGYEVVFLASIENQFAANVEHLRRNGMTTLAGASDAKDFLAEARDFVKFVFLARAQNAYTWLQLLESICPEIPIVFDTVDIHHLREFEEAELENSESKRLTASSTKRTELFMAERSAATVVVSNRDADYLETFIQRPKIHVVGTIHRISDVVVPFSERKGLLFVGSFAHMPNADGLEWFFREVWQHIDPSIRRDGMNIIGSNPPAKLLKAAPSGVSYLGWVESTNPFVDSARLSISPLRYGAGIKGKVGEAWARGLPVIGTSSTFKGMVEPGNIEFPSVDDPLKFAELINEVYSSESAWMKSSEAGHRRVQDTLSREVAKKSLVDLINFVSK